MPGPVGSPASAAWFAAQRAAIPSLLCPAYDQDGRRSSYQVGVHPVDAWVEFQARMRYQSAPALERTGTKYHKLRKLADSAESFLRFETYRWLKPAIDAKWIKVETVQVEIDRDTGLAAVWFLYTNLFTQRQGQRVSVPVR